VLFSTDKFFSEYRGAPQRALTHPMHWAIALSMVLHAALMLYLLSPHSSAKLKRGDTFEVGLTPIGIVRSDAGQTDIAAVHPSPYGVSADAAEDRHVVPRVRVEEAAGWQTHKDVGSAAGESSSANDPQISGMPIPQELPIPSPGRRPLWSFRASAVANAQAGYHAQVQRQAVSNLKHHTATGRSRYEFFLKEAMTGLSLKGTCRVVVPFQSKFIINCESQYDVGRVEALLGSFGSIPGIPGDEPLDISITPGDGNGPNILG
jgi:hypothetical protein